jgi:hypothetical protein
VSEEPTNQPSKGSPLLGCVGLVVVAAVGLYACTASLGGSGEDGGPDQYGAEAACQEFVERRLKSPSTAEFDTTATGGPTTFTVTGTVDSQNSFGAMVRNEFTCVTTARGEEWVLDSLSGLTN